MLIDSHSHIYFSPLDSREDAILMSMREHGISHAIQIGCNPESNKLALDLAKKYPHLPATVGIHPTDGQIYTREDILREVVTLDRIISENRQYIVGVGETGLDYFHLTDESQKQTQAKLFLEQCELAKKYCLPLIIHCRNARDDMFELIKKSGVKKFVMHCYSEDFTFAKQLLEYSDEVYFSFSGILTYKNALQIQETATNIPLSRVLIETDSPFLAPQPMRGQVNEPSNVRFVFEKLCELRQESQQETEDSLFSNSLQFYKIQV